jgi:hypothetical protein
MSLISAVTARGHMRFMIIDKGSVNADVFIEFLKRLIRAQSAKSFDSRSRLSSSREESHAFVHTLGGKLRLFFLPPIHRTATPTSWCGSIERSRKAAQAVRHVAAECFIGYLTALRR